MKAKGELVVRYLCMKMDRPTCTEYCQIYNTLVACNSTEEAINEAKRALEQTPNPFFAEFVELATSD
jgi:hypothetical protein